MPADDYSRHEAMHMAYVIGEMVEHYLLEHQSIKDNHTWAILAESASAALGRLYQLIGEEHL